MSALMLFLLFLIGLYCLPGIIASLRGTRNVVAVWFVDLALGWTVIGWVIALAMALGETWSEAEARRSVVVMSRSAQLPGGRSTSVARAAGASPTQRYCTACGAPVGPGKYCGECGAPFIGVSGSALPKAEKQAQLAP